MWMDPRVLLQDWSRDPRLLLPAAGLGFNVQEVQLALGPPVAMAAPLAATVPSAQLVEAPTVSQDSVRRWHWRRGIEYPSVGCLMTWPAPSQVEWLNFPSTTCGARTDT